MKIAQKQKLPTGIYDHLRNKYNSSEEMCKKYGITVQTLCVRLNNGYSIRESLVGLRTSNKQIYDSKGRRFSSLTDMCEMYGVSIGAVRKRMSMDIGMSLEEALNTPYRDADAEAKRIAKRRKLESMCVDHKGNIFDNMLMMCVYWNVPVADVRHRLEKGISLERALTTPVPGYTEHTDITFEIMGRRYLDIAELSKNFPNTGGKRKIQMLIDELYYKKWDKEVVAVAGIINKEHQIILDHVGIDGKSYYKVTWAPGVLVTARDIVKYYAPEKVEIYDKYNPTGKRNLIEHLERAKRIAKSKYVIAGVYDNTIFGRLDRDKLENDVAVLGR